MHCKIHSTITTFLILSALTWTSGWADDSINPPPTLPSLEEIVVTGDFRERTLNELALSATAVGQQQIERRSAKHLEEILALVPNLSFASGGNRARFYQIRGIGERSQFSEPVNSSVGLLIDEVDFSAAGAAGTLFDVKQVEVLRGPQGTLYGAGAMAGLINVQTNEPTFTPDGRVEYELGSNGLVTGGVAYGGPIIPQRLLYRVAAQYHKSDGTTENEHVGRPTNNRNELTLRTKLRWLLYDALTLDAHLSYIDTDNGYDAFSLDNVREVLSDEPGTDRQQSLLGGIGLTFDQDAMKLKLLLNFTDVDIDYGYDEDWVFAGFHPDGYSSTDRYQRDRQTLSAEARLISDPQAGLFDGKVDWLLGLYLLAKTVDLTRTPKGFTSSYDTAQFAFYGEADIHLGNRLTLSTGFRLESWEADYKDSNQVSFDPAENLWGGRVALEWQADSGALIYGSVARGYKTGGFNTEGSLIPALREFDSESLYNFELGIKRNWAENRVAAQVALFYMTRDDVQISSSVEVPRPDSPAPEFISFVGNAAEGTNQGIEIELQLWPHNRWQVGGTLAFLDTEYEDFINAEGEDFSGRDQAHAPGWQYSLNTEYRTTPNSYVRLEMQGRDTYYFSDSHNGQSSRANVLHLRAGLESGNTSLSVWVRNALDEDVETRGFFFGADPRDGYQAHVYTQLDEQRTFGVTLAKNF